MGCTAFTRVLGACVASAMLQLAGCGSSFHYTDHPLRVTDESGRAPIHNALVRVTYSPVYCGGPFAFLGTSEMPEPFQTATNADGVAIVPLELEWPYGFRIDVSAQGYSASNYARGRGMKEKPPPVPHTFKLKADGQSP